MQATDVLKSEHRVIERVLVVFEQGVKRYEEGESLELRFFKDVVAFFRGFADGCHHQKEEQVLFTAMVEHGVPAQNGPVGAMLHEHEIGRHFLREIDRAIDRLQDGDKSATKELLENGRGYINLLKQHIFKEDQILFPMADRVIPTAEHLQVLNRFDTIEHEEVGEGLHEKYLDLAQDLESELYSV
jgi:hemerythrin-like domain-containing protein